MLYKQLLLFKRHNNELIIIIIVYLHSYYTQKLTKILASGVYIPHYDLHCTHISKINKINYQIFKCKEAKISLDGAYNNLPLGALSVVTPLNSLQVHMKIITFFKKVFINNETQYKIFELGNIFVHHTYLSILSLILNFKLKS